MSLYDDLKERFKKDKRTITYVSSHMENYAVSDLNWDDVVESIIIWNQLEKNYYFDFLDDD